MLLYVIRDTENYIPVRILIKATFVPSTYTFKPLTELPVTDDCHSNRNRPPTIFVLSWDTECYPSLALMVHSVFLLAWSHSEMESSSTHSVYSFESVETTVIVISCGRANSGLELISALDKALPIFALRDTENYANEMTGPPAEMTVTQFQSVDLKVTVAPSLLHVGALSFPASFTANFATPETKYRHAFPFPLPSIMTSATARC